MNKHTPGPWESSRMLLSPNAKDRRCGFVEGEANARLIAAAPELLSALQAMVEMFERHITGHQGPDDAADRWDRAREAIAKATGATDAATTKFFNDRHDARVAAGNQSLFGS